MRNNIEIVLRERYELDPMKCEANALGWAADYLVDEVGLERAAREANRLNDRRSKAGMRTWAPHPASPIGKAMAEARTIR